MVLVDSSVWADHFRRPEQRLVALLEAGEVLTHSMVIGELACGHLTPRHAVLELLQELPQAVEASHPEVMTLIERARLFGTGLGFVDAHLLASTLLSGVELWTRDVALARAASRLHAG